MSRDQVKYKCVSECLFCDCDLATLKIGKPVPNLKSKHWCNDQEYVPPRQAEKIATDSKKFYNQHLPFDISLTYDEAVVDRKKIKQQYTRHVTALICCMFAQLSKKDVISLRAELQVIAEEVLAANAIVIRVATEDALERTKNLNAEFEVNFKEISDRVFKFIAPPTPMNSSPQPNAGGFTEEDDQEDRHVPEILQSSIRDVRTSYDRRPDSPIANSSHAMTLRHVGNFPNLSREADAQPYFTETRQSMLARRLPKTNTTV